MTYVLTHEGLQRYNGKILELIRKKMEEHVEDADEKYVHQDQNLTEGEIDDAIEEAEQNSG